MFRVGAVPLWPPILLIIFSLFFNISASLAEERYSLLGNLKEDFTYIATSPSRMDRNSALVTLGIIGTGVVLYTQDDKIRDYAQDHQSSSADNISTIAEKFGNGLYDLAFLALYGGSGYLLENEKMQETSLLSFESFIVANTIGTVVKTGAGRTRPNEDEGSTKFSPFSFDSAHTSFPSGHTTSAFSIASVFADEYDEPWVDVTAYGLASAVALQRVYDDKHWASDVFAGAVLGTVVGKSVVYLHKDKKAGNVYLVPITIPSEGKYGMVAVFRF
ncbi:MAG: phosphatase PAP2 family protein [Deltaproteobacteria bacterium]|nr:phosphatase PAP2 family protein [Deltaproteobacteria bacterium]